MSNNNSSTALVSTFGQARADAVLLKNWRTRLTRYCNRRSTETGTPASRFRAAIKASLTKRGYNTSSI